MGFALPAIFVVYISGQLIAYLLNGEQPLTLILISSLSILLLLIWRRCAAPRLSWWLSILLISSPLVAGYLSTLGAVRRPPFNVAPSLTVGERVDLVGELYRAPEHLRESSRIYLNRCEIVRDGIAEKLDGRVRITIYEGRMRLSAGDIVLVKSVRLRPPKNFNNPGSFNYENYMKVRRIDAVGGVSSTSRIRRLGRSDSFSLGRPVERLKESLLARIDAVLPPARASLFKAVILGQRSALDEETKNLFIQAGTAHLLAISGLHVGFVALFSYHVIRVLMKLIKIRFLKMVGDRFVPSRVASLATIVPVVFYSLLVGSRISCIRATIMIAAYLMARFLYRERHLYSTISLAGLAILVWNPLALFDIGFQFSFLTVFAILYVNSNTSIFRWGREDSPVPIKHEENRSRYRRLMVFPLVSVVAGIAVLPLTAYYFNRVSVGGIIANSVAVPIAMVAIPMGLVASMFSLLSNPVTDFILYFSGEAVGLLSRISGLVAGFKVGDIVSSYRVPTPPILALIGYYIAGFSLFRLKRDRWAPLAAAISLVLLIGASGWKALAATHGDTLRATFFDVGQGDSTLLELPDGGRVMIDGGAVYGANFNVGERVIAPYLRRRWIGRLDLLISSHPHPDHLGGLLALLEEFSVGAYWESKGAERFNSALHQEVVEGARAKGAEVMRYERWLAPMEMGGVRFQVLHPSGEFIEMLKREGEEGDLFLNDTSLVVGVTHGEVGFLFTGDIGRAAQRYVSALGEPLRYKVLKVPHHGGGRSNTRRFLEAVRPEVAVVSVGEFNPYGHPSLRVLRDLRGMGARVYRTDRCGAVTVETDGERVWAKTFLGWRGGAECSPFESRGQPLNAPTVPGG